jgi:hypothetical protein
LFYRNWALVKRTPGCRIDDAIARGDFPAAEALTSELPVFSTKPIRICLATTVESNRPDPLQ